MKQKEITRKKLTNEKRYIKIKIMIANKLKIARGLKKLTIKELAEKTGLSAKQVINIESGITKKPQIQTILKLCNELELKPEDIL